MDSCIDQILSHSPINFLTTPANQNDPFALGARGCTGDCSHDEEQEDKEEREEEHDEEREDEEEREEELDEEQEDKEEEEREEQEEEEEEEEEAMLVVLVREEVAVSLKSLSLRHNEQTPGGWRCLGCFLHRVWLFFNLMFSIFLGLWV